MHYLLQYPKVCQYDWFSFSGTTFSVIPFSPEHFYLILHMGLPFMSKFCQCMSKYLNNKVLVLFYFLFFCRNKSQTTDCPLFNRITSLNKILFYTHLVSFRILVCFWNRCVILAYLVSWSYPFSGLPATFSDTFSKILRHVSLTTSSFKF